MPQDETYQETQIVCVEVSHHNTPVHLREKLSIPSKKLPEALHLLFDNQTKIQETFILSTCNRTAIYAVSPSHEPLIHFLSSYHKLKQEEFLPYLSVYQMQSAIEHLFATAAGLESQALGERQIMDQIRSAYKSAIGCKTIGPVLAELIRRAIQAGNQVHQQTKLGDYSSSIGHLVIKLIQHFYPKIERTQIMIIGTGDMGTHMCSLLFSRGIRSFYNISHTRFRPGELVSSIKEDASCLLQLLTPITYVDVVVSATQAETYVLTEKDIADLLPLRTGMPLLLIDLGIPRNIEPSAGNLPGVKLYNLDDLKSIKDAELEQKLQELPKAREIIKEHALLFIQWLKEREIAPWISLIQQNAENIRQKQLQSALSMLQPLSEPQHRVIEKLTLDLTKKLLHEHMQSLKTLARHIQNPREVFSRSFNSVPDKTRKIIVGTRGSVLALRQTQSVLEHLQKNYSDIKFITKVIRTSGDRGQLKSPGAFIKELEQALLRGEVDLCIHSLKDLPAKIPEGLKLAAVVERADPRDVLISRKGLKLAELPPGARVGTGSPRRTAQLMAIRPDLTIVSIMGNVDTRLRKLNWGQYDAIVLAAAGLMRLGLQQKITEYIPIEVIIPAPGQGALAVEIRENDHDIEQIVSCADHTPTRIAITAEKAFLEELGGGCRVPIASYAEIVDNKLIIYGFIGTEDGKQIFREKLTGDPAHPEELGRQLARQMLQQGASKLFTGI